MDLIIVCALSLLVAYLYLGDGALPNANLYFAATGICLFISASLFSILDLYSERRLLSGDDNLRRVWTAWAIAAAIFLLTAFGLKISDQFSRVWFVTWISITAVALAIHHTVLRLLVRHWAREGLLAARTVIVGASDNGLRLARHLKQNSDIKTRIIGFVDDRAERVPPIVEGYAVMGGMSALESMIRRGAVDEVVIALPWQAGERIREIAHKLAAYPVQIRLAPDLAGFNFMQRQYSFLAGLPMLNVFDRPMSGWSSVAKAVEDRVLAGLLLVLLSPLLLLIAVLVKLESPGPVFFRQRRPGFNHELINVLKFRTMYVDSRYANGEVQAMKTDPRVTRIGRWLRKTSLDELPQLLNVLQGDMSIVGPRPHPVAMKAAGRQLEEVVDDYAARHRVKPGITGWAQVNGWRGETDTEEKIRKRVEHDLYYIENWSLWLDIRIILKTVFTVLKGQNAY